MSLVSADSSSIVEQLSHAGTFVVGVVVGIGTVVLVLRAVSDTKRGHDDDE